MTLTVGSICSGIGGWDLGLERAGMRVCWQVEIDPWCRRVLERHWPDVTRYEDAFKVNYAEVEKVDVIAAGYPCQPFSVAGHQDGHDDPRNVWPAVRRAVRDVRPRWVLLENVTGHLVLGFGRVLGELAALGYDATWDCIPAAAFGAPHLRDRVWIVAHDRRTTADTDGFRVWDEQQRLQCEPTVDGQGLVEHDGTSRPTADADSAGLEERHAADQPAGARLAVRTPASDHAPHPNRFGRESVSQPHAERRRGLEQRERRDDAERLDLLGVRHTAPQLFEVADHWRSPSPEPCVRGVHDGLSSRLDRRALRELRKTDRAAWELEMQRRRQPKHRLKGCGNALVPQIAEWIAWNVLMGGVETQTDPQPT
jgi:DNA (cytosine-5)-methyltransferase 1